MGFYDDNTTELSEFGLDEDLVFEAFLADDIQHNFNDKAKEEICAEGGLLDALSEAKVLSGERSMMRLSKMTDLQRRKMIIAIQMARAAHDPQYDKLVHFKMLYKNARNKIVSKYGNKAERAAKISQKAYIKKMKNVNLSNSGAGAFITQDPNR